MIIPTKDERLITPLTKALQNERFSSIMRSSAAEALGKIGNAKAVPYLIKALDDKDKYVRVNSVVALGEIGDKQAVPSIKNALSDNEEYVRRIAQETLEKFPNNRLFSIFKRN